MNRKFEIKEWVRSKRVGSARAFNGQIVDMMHSEYVVRDENKVKWLRAEAELEKLT